MRNPLLIMLYVGVFVFCLIAVSLFFSSKSQATFDESTALRRWISRVVVAAVLAVVVIGTVRHLGPADPDEAPYAKP